jgi:hypothetical protein
MWSILFSVIVLAAGPSAKPTPPAGVEKLAWMAGHWSMESRGRTIEEHWMRPAGNTMIGMGRTVSGDRTIEFEFLQIKQEGEDIFYMAQPKGGSPTPFKLVRSSDTEAVFENLKHDFPQRILYRKQADGSVHARIEGESQGKTRGIDFPYKKAKCVAKQ